MSLIELNHVDFFLKGQTTAEARLISEASQLLFLVNCTPMVELFQEWIHHVVATIEYRSNS